DQIVTFIELDEQGTIIPCSPTKILASSITTLRPERRLLPVGFQTDFKTRLQKVTSSVDEKLRSMGQLPADGELPPPFEVVLEDALDFIDRVSPTFAEFE